MILSADAYRHFVKENNLSSVINNELGRKPLESMRWEEVWDAALRIRTNFLKKPIPEDLLLY